MLIGVVEHICDLDIALDRIRRLLAPNAELFMSCTRCKQFRTAEGRSIPGI